MNTKTNGLPVIVGVDGSEGADAAARWAARYASETGVSVRLTYAGGAAATLNVPVGLRRAERSRDRALAAAVDAASYGSRTPVSASAVAGAAAPTLIDASAEASLLVLGSNDHGRFGSVAVRVIAEAYCPVVVVRGDAEPDGPVVVAVDASETSEPALRFAFREAARRRSALFVVHAWQQPLVPVGAGIPAAVAAGAPDRAGRAAAAQLSITDVIAPWREAFPDVAVHERLVEGSPETVVTEETSGAALVVVGSRGRGALAGLLLGSTSQALVRGSDCPVAVVRQPGTDPTAV